MEYKNEMHLLGGLINPVGGFKIDPSEQLTIHMFNSLDENSQLFQSETNKIKFTNLKEETHYILFVYLNTNQESNTNIYSIYDLILIDKKITDNFIYKQFVAPFQKKSNVQTIKFTK